MFDAMIDPTANPAEAVRATPPAPRPDRLRGLTVGLLANTKANAEDLLERVGELLATREGIAGVVRRKKLSITDPVPADVLADLARQCDVVVVGVGDCGSCSASAIADGLALEAEGIPAVVICTEAFSAAADAMAELQGSPGYEYVRIPHPLALLDAEGVRARAEQVLPAIVGGVTTASSATAAA
ncbi:UGSC family (seleno)protein [Prauserella muralis]|uniref:UGSC-like domain-containing protein n=1 Tax=Prauserella muralis TaxID=588067 RepID=A0A2V4AXZ7_9PSEU|nr:UGSC family (seleno)protein [Prauserella muralis]PXY20800.1 hypothetical protein BAY60_25140 [Prauserella muralis]TWE29825.1 hypothetical protein FHX69_2515 [Prauserella muralis]